MTEQDTQQYDERPQGSDGHDDDDDEPREERGKQGLTRDDTTQKPQRVMGPHGFPEGTPVAEMTVEEQRNYYQHQSRENEKRWKKVRDRNLTPDQIVQMQDQLDAMNREKMDETARRVDDAKRAAARETRESLLPHLVRARIEAAVARRSPELTDAEIQTHTEFLDLSKFLTSDGEVDADKVSNYAASIVPSAQRGAGTRVGDGVKFPDMGGGRREPIPVSGKERGLAIARERGWTHD